MLRTLLILAALALPLVQPSQAAVFVAAPPASAPPSISENASTVFLEDGSESRIGLLAHNDPVNHTDPTGLVIDTIADIGFIGYDLYRLVADGPSGRSDNFKALGLDAAAAAIPFATGAGAAFRGVKAVERAAEAAKMAKTAEHAAEGRRLRELPGLDQTGKVHGQLPQRNDLGRVSTDDLKQLNGDLRKSVQERHRTNAELGSDPGHDKRITEEQRLLQAIAKELKGR